VTGADGGAIQTQIFDQISANAQLQSFNEQYHVLSNVKNFFSTQGAKITSEGLIGGGIVGSVLGGVSAGIIIFIFSFFILLEGRIVWDKLLKFFNPAITIRISRVAEKMRRAVSGFVNGNLIISLIAGIVTLIPLLIFKVPYAFALAALVALFDLIPLVGAAIATIVVGLVALVKGWLVAVIIVGILLVYQFIEGHVIQPVVYSRTVRLSPFLIILATIIGAELLGIMGVLLGIPIAAVIQLAVLETLVGTETNQVKLAPKPTESRIDS
jgi:predicted PurR-regulated permease PerM